MPLTIMLVREIEPNLYLPRGKISIKDDAVVVFELSLHQGRPIDYEKMSLRLLTVAEDAAFATIACTQQYELK